MTTNPGSPYPSDPIMPEAANPSASTEHAAAAATVGGGHAAEESGALPWSLMWGSLGATLGILTLSIGMLYLELNRSNDPSAQALGGDPVARGGVLFPLHCAKCHGPEGRGNGPSANTCIPRPRDFTAVKWRFEKSSESITKVLNGGIPGTQMPAFNSALTAQNISDLTAFVLKLSEQAPSTTSALTDPVEAAGLYRVPPKAAPELDVTDLSDASLSLSSLAGKPVLLHFWNSSAPQTKAEFPPFVEFIRPLEQLGLVVVSVCVDEEDAEVLGEFLAEVAPGQKVFVDSSASVSSGFALQSPPEVYLVDRDGQIKAKGLSGLDWKNPALVQLFHVWLQATSPVLDPVAAP